MASHPSGPVIGFEQTSYGVTEGEDSAAELCAVLRQGTLDRAITLSFFTINGSATGRSRL